MTALPAASDFTGSTRTEGQVKAALTDLRGFLADLFGTDGAAQTAQAALGVFAAQTINVTADATVTAADRGRILRVTATATLTLPALSAVPAGWTAVIRCSAGGTATVNAAGADLISGVAGVVLRPSTWIVLSAMATEWVAWGAGGALDVAAGSAAAPGQFFNGDPDTGSYSPGANQIGWTAGGTLRLLLSTTALTAAVPLLAPAGSASAPAFSFSGDTNSGLFAAAADAIGVALGGVDKARWTTTGLRLGAYAIDPDAALDLRGTDAISAGIHIHRSSDDTGGATLRLRKSRGTPTSPTAPQTNDTLGTLFFGGLESGSTYANAASIVGIADANFASGSAQARLSLRTAPAGSNTVAERLRLDSTAAWVTGRLHVNTAEANAAKVTIADDATYVFTPGRTGGFLLMTAGGHVGTTATFEPHSAMVFFDVGSAAAFCAKSTGISGVGGQVDVVTGTTLTGTTGTDGNITVSAKTDGTLTIENRRGAATTFTLWVH